MKMMTTTMRFAGDYPMPVWLALVYLTSNVVLNTLNFYWFGKMIETVKNRFAESKDKSKKKKEGGEDRDQHEGVMVEGLMDSSTLITEIKKREDGEMEEQIKVESVILDGKSMVEVEKTEVRRRKE